MTKNIVRCAIYVRKSSEEGLEQEFNSLDAQRESCEAYIRSQKHEGWIALETRYDDPGISGGTMNRPALRHLLSDIEAGQVDVVVVYKVDRLTRSLADFAKIIEIFDRQKTSFVSITQQFSTTTSMGRLTLNMLLSFAQFEREVTGERIRDKIAASKQKGMWMGGRVPLGYDAAGRTLSVNEAEASIVRTIYAVYLEVRAVRPLKQELDRRGIRSKLRQLPSGVPAGGCSFSPGNLYAILSNALYVGEIRHRDKLYLGQHPAIVSREVWDAVQGQLAANRHKHRHRTDATNPSLLSNLIFDASGARLTPTHTRKGQRRYRYYAVSKTAGAAERRQDMNRIPAHEIDQLTVNGVCKFLRDDRRVLECLDWPERASDCLAAAQKVALLISGNTSDARDVIRAIVQRVAILEDHIELVIAVDALAGKLGVDSADPYKTLLLQIPATVLRCRGSAKLIVPGEGAARPSSKPDPLLIKGIIRAQNWYRQLIDGRVENITALAEENGLSASFTTRALRLAFLAPDIIESIFDGRHPPTLSIDGLLQRSADIPLKWSDQRRFLDID